MRCCAAAGREYRRRLLDEATQLMRLTGFAEYELSLMLVGDRAIRRLNREFRDRDEPTDVLSFPQFETAMLAGGLLSPAVISPRAVRGADAPLTALGDIVISVETAARQARALGVSPAARLRTLLIHGLTHLLGYDHERSPAEARRQFARERRLAARLGAGAQAAPALLAPLAPLAPSLHSQLTARARPRPRAEAPQPLPGAGRARRARPAPGPRHPSPSRHDLP